jgi:hypothetical protein
MTKLAEAKTYSNKLYENDFLAYGTDLLWRAVPFLIFLAVFSPIFAAAYRDFSSGALPLQNPQSIATGETLLRAIIIRNFGETGLKLFSLLPAAIMMFSIAKITKLFDVPLWARAIATSLIVVLPIFNLAPNLWERPDDAIFAALCIFMAYNLIKSVKYSNQLNLGAAFFIAIIITFLRPISFWPQILIFLVARLMTPAFKHDAKYGLLTSLIWGPGVFAIMAFVDAFQSQGPINSAKSALSIVMQNSIINDVTGNAFNFLGFLPSMMSLVLLLFLGGLGLLFLLTNENRVKKHYFAAAFILLWFIGVAVFGGGLPLARLILDPLLLSLAATLACVSSEKFRLFATPFNFNFQREKANSPH